MITALVSIKGGVGKTTTAVNLAAALARAGYRVLVLDLDSQASASLSLGLGRRDLAPSSADVLMRSRAAAEAIRPAPAGGVHVLPASADLLSAEGDLAYVNGKEKLLAHSLAAVRNAYDFIFIDCPPGLGLLTRNALVAADCYLVPTVPHFLASEGLRNLVLAVERLAYRHSHRIRLAGILPTIVDYRTRVAREQILYLRSVFGDRVFGVEIRINTKLAEAPERGVTVFEHDPRAVGAACYRALASELLKRTGTRVEEEERREVAVTRPAPEPRRALRRRPRALEIPASP